MRIAIGADHVAYEFKEKIKEYIRDKGYQWTDFGAHSKERVDYTDYGFTVGEAVASGEYERGIVCCGTGVGISIAANKVKGIRCVVCSEPYSAKLSREHNNTNILSMGARVVGIELAKMIIDEWLQTSFEGGRHLNRIEQITTYENNH
ncbi:MAG: ribose 5-phosphate isomerase B [Tannerellaceae bacterium]|jgi:ribose 5-phosphate isomerase B|nr:ribose 5-phosphate isomerase B [Tannerellaceae bacterium]